MANSKVYDLTTATSISRTDVLYLVQGDGTLDRKITLGDLYDWWSSLSPATSTLILEDGLSHLLLEDGTSKLTME